MKDTQKRFLGAVLAASSVAGIVAPSVTAMATVVDDESKATAEDLKAVIAEYTTKLEANPIFANYHRVQYAAERLAQYDKVASQEALVNIGGYADKVFTEEVKTIVDKMDGFASSKSMATYDELVTKDIKAMENKENAEYLMGRLDVWGKAIVFEVDPNYVVATDAIIKVADLRKAGKLDEAQKQVDVAKKAIKEIKTYAVNGAYLEASLKVEIDAIENEIAKQDLHVTSVVAKNGREIEVKFNKAVSKDSAEKVENYEFASANSDAKTIDADEAELQDDNKTVKLTLKDNLTLNNKTNAKYLVKVHDVVTDNDKNMDDFSEIIALFDNVKPEVTGLEYTDSDTVRINFSEPINAADGAAASSAVKVKLNGATVSVKSSAFKLDDDKMYLELSKSAANLEKDKTYSIEIDGLTDYAANSLTKFTGDITFKKDDVDPEVEKIETLSPTDFKVTFSEKIKLQRATEKDEEKNVLSKGFSVKVDGKDAENIEIKDNEKLKDADDKTFTVKIKDANFKEGNHTVTIYGFTDLSDNKGESVTEEVNFEKSHPVLENTTPEYKTMSIKDKDGKIVSHKFAVYTFDRDVEVSNKDVTVKHVDSDGVTKEDPATLHDSKELSSLESYEIAVDINNLEEAKYNFDLEKVNVVDVYGQDVEKINLQFTKSANGSKAEVAGFVKNNQEGTDQSKKNKVVVKFNEDLTTSALDASKYTVDGIQAFEKAELKGDKKTLELTLKDGVIKTSGQKVLAVTGVNGVKDFNDNVIKGTKIEFVENERPVIDKAEVISYNTVKLTMSEVVNDFKGKPLEVKINGNKVKEDVTVTGKGTDTLVIKLHSADELRNSSDKVTIDVLEADTTNSIADKEGNNAEKTTINAEVNFDSLLADAIKKVEAYEDGTGTLDDAQKAVDDLKDGSADKINLQARIDAKKGEAAEAEKTKAKEELNAAIITATDAMNDVSVTEGVVAGNTIVGSKATLDTAIKVAKAAVDDKDSTTKDLTEAKTTLKTAVDTFKAAKVVAITGLNDITITGTASDESNTIGLADVTKTVVTSSKTEFATVELSGKNVKVTGVAAGTSTITVEVKDANGHVIEVGSFVVTVS
ncbi:hypothetical protein [Clostridium frigidicarnis]|uniref:Ig-like domain (Group 3) n=1 Tax=Clostridium frigidicarnis TaxID=84698 RepID=A0A1I0VY01_9CLOT|nr:hypothetical protein [Clostridium frigidicarnis]SFA81231.1 hypothetical protein SAMN04488528_1003115 [Clostridium frigidicarnis]